MTRLPTIETAALSASFDIQAERDPNVSCRVLGHFAQLGMTPSRVRICALPDEIHLRVTQPGLGEHAAEVVAEKLRSLVLVRAVRLEHHVGSSVGQPERRNPASGTSAQAMFGD